MQMQQSLSTVSGWWQTWHWWLQLVSSWMQRPTVGKGGGSGVRGREGQLVNRSAGQQVNKSTGQQVNKSTQDETNWFQTNSLKKSMRAQLFFVCNWKNPKSIMDFLLELCLCPAGYRGHCKEEGWGGWGWVRGGSTGQQVNRSTGQQVNRSTTSLSGSSHFGSSHSGSSHFGSRHSGSSHFGSSHSGSSHFGSSQWWWWWWMSTGQQVNRGTTQPKIRQTEFKRKNESASIFQIKRKSKYELSIGTVWGPPVGFIPLLYLFILLGGCPVGVRAPPVPQAMLTWSPWFPWSGPGIRNARKRKGEAHAKANRPGDRSEGSTKL